MSKRQRSTRGQSSSSQEVSIEEKFRRLGVIQNRGSHQLIIDISCKGKIIRETSLIGSSLLAKTSIKHSLTPSVPTPSPGLNGEIFSVLMSLFIGNWFVSSLLHLSSMPLLIGWRIGLYSKGQSRENATLSRLRDCNTVKESRLLIEFWPTIRDGGFNVGNANVASIRDPRVKLAHRCIATTIAGRKETTYRVIEINLDYLYCIYTPEVACNIPYWLSKYLKGVKDKNLIYGGMLVTKIARSFGLLTNDFRNALCIKPPPHVFKKKSLITMDVIMELQNRMCDWPTVRAIEEEEDKDDDKGDKAAGVGVGHEEAGGSTAIYCNMSQGDWQVRQARWMDQQYKQWGRLNTWMGQQDERANWMYDHTVRQFQYMSIRDNLDPRLQIDPFLGREADYPPYGYTGHMPPGYEYRFGPAPGGSE
ncbi:hypothetical protein Tco_0575936 [Tanacetum coccineum]